MKKLTVGSGAVQEGGGEDEGAEEGDPGIHPLRRSPRRSAAALLPAATGIGGGAASEEKGDAGGVWKGRVRRRNA